MDLKDISKKDKYWRSIAFNICKDKHLANDLVQEMYLKIYDVEEKDINDYYVALTINNLFLDICRKKKLTVDIDTIYNLQSKDNVYEFDDVEIKYLERAESLNFVRRKLLEFNYDHSLLELQNKYNINYGYIFRQLKLARKEILKEDYDRLYKNKRFKNCRNNKNKK